MRRWRKLLPVAAAARLRVRAQISAATARSYLQRCALSTLERALGVSQPPTRPPREPDPPPGAPSRMPSVEESELEAGFGLAEDSRPGPTGLAEISYTEQRTSASL